MTNQPTSLLDIAVRRVRHDPSTPMLLTIDADCKADGLMTYGDVLDRATLLAAVLADFGVDRGDRVGCYLSNSPSWVVASLAVWHCGATVGAVGTLLPGPEASALFELAATKVVIAGFGAPEIEPGHLMVNIDETGLVVEHRNVSVPTNELALPDPDDSALVIFTSGTTGRPKGITHTHDDLISAARRVAAAYAALERLSPRTGAGASASWRGVQPLWAHGRIQPLGVPNVDRSSHRDPHEVHRGCRSGAVGPLSDGFTTADADNAPHVGHC